MRPKHLKNITVVFTFAVGLAGVSMQVAADTQVGVLLEPPMSAAAGSAGDAATNQGQAVSADGRFVVFTSYATNLVDGDTNGARDVFLWDSLLDVVERINLGTDASGSSVQANADSSDAVISADGNWIAFSSSASNLQLNSSQGDTEGDTNSATEDVFLYSRASGQVELVSKSTLGMQSQSAALRPDINANGRFVTFDAIGELASGAGDVNRQIFRRDTWTNTTELISQTPAGVAANGLSMDAQMSANGQRVVYVSMATNLSSVDTVGKESFLRDMANKTTQLLSLNAAGEAGDGISYFPTISGDGEFAAFHTNASNLVAGDRVEFADVVLRNLTTGELELISQSVSGDAANDFNIHPSLSYDGSRVLFASNATNLVSGDAAAQVDVFLADRELNELSLLSQNLSGAAANGDSAAPSLSYDGRHASFATLASNLSANGTSFSDVVLARLDDSEAATVGLAAAVLPSSRSVRLGEPLTAFASVIGTDIASNCSVALGAEFDAANNIELQVQATDPLTNRAVGTANSSFLLLPGIPQTLLLTLTPTAAIQAQELDFSIRCSNGIAPVTSGTNTLLISAETTQPADVVALAATLDNNGIVSFPAGDGAGFFTVATVNLGTTQSMQVRPVVLGAALERVSVCQTNPVTSVCLAPAEAFVSTTIESAATPTFAVFVSNAEPVEFLPGTNRLVLQFEDGDGIVRGRTSVAVRSVAP